MLPCWRVFSALIVMFVAFNSAPSFAETDSPTPSCITVLDIANRTYFTQVEYMRRGLGKRPAYSMYVRFIEQLSTLASQLPNEDSFGAYCISNSEIESRVNTSTDTLLSMVLLEDTIIKFGAPIPLLTRTNNPIIPADTSAGVAEWALTRPYFMESMEQFINASRIHFPEQLSVLYDPYQNESCASFNSSFFTANVATMAAQNMSQIMLSLVSVLINMGADPRKSTQLVTHNTALSYVGTRCKRQTDDVLQLPISYMEVYGRQAARLSKGNNLAAKAGINLSFLREHGTEMVKLLDGFHSGGVIPTNIVSSFGSLTAIQGEWDCIADEFSAIEQAQSLLQKPLTLGELGSYLSTFEVFHSSVTSRTTLESLARPLGHRRNNSFVERDVVCNTGWVFIATSVAVNNPLEECCADMCLAGSLEMQEPAAGEFRNGCCQRCNQIFCPADETDDDLVDLITFNIIFPPYGQSTNGSVPVMI